MLDVTWACDQRCAFCYNPADLRSRGHPPVEQLLEIQRRLAHWDVQEVLYLGGEPLTHPGIAPLLRQGHHLGLRQRLVTNGSRLDAAFADLLATLHVEVGVSLHAVDPDVHDRLTRRPGSFFRALAALDALLHAGTQVWVQHSPTRLNPGHLAALGPFLRARYGSSIRYIDVNRLLPLGEAASVTHRPAKAASPPSLLLDEDGWWSTLREVTLLLQSGWSARVESVPHCWIRHRAATDTSHLGDSCVPSLLAALRPCWMGIAQLALDPAGRIKLCPAAAPIGPSILDDDPSALWHTSPPLIARRQLRFLDPICVDYQTGHLCPDFYACGGGCRGGSAPGEADTLSTSGLFGSSFSHRLVHA
jgi:MoaA/NifB/PqqE/SkfB family radical SAM enzyme